MTQAGLETQVIDACPLCGAKKWRPIYEADAPLRLTVTPDDPIESTMFERLCLSACTSCGHLFNSNFDRGLEAAIYRDQPLTNVVVDPSMGDRYDALLDWLGRDAFEGKRVIEIGGGGGYIACLLARGGAEVTVYEPSSAAPAAILAEHGVTLVNDFWPAASNARKADLIVCRQVLEHLSDPVAMMRSIHASLCDGGKAYLEVPAADYVLEHGAFTDVHVQHVQYFTRERFIGAAARAGLRAEKVLDIKDGHDFGVLFTRGEPEEEGAAPETPTIGSGHTLTERVRCAGEILRRLPQPIALYGATLHAQTFISAIPDTPPIALVFDDNAALADREIYTRTQRMPVQPLSAARLRDIASVVITAYLHDMPIAAKLRATSFSGRILSIRPRPVEANSLGLAWLYDASTAHDRSTDTTADQ